MSTLTLVGTSLAHVGEEFVYRGEASGCAGCPYRKQCLNLTDGRRYRVTSVRDDASVLDCALHDEGVTAVEVEPAPVTAAVDASTAYAGSVVTLSGPCPHTGCASHEFCEPAGVDYDDEYRIDEVLGDPPHDYCHLDRDLALVRLQPRAESD